MLAADMMSILVNIQERLSNIEKGFGGGGGGGSASGSSNLSELPKSMTAFDEYLELHLTPFVASCEKLGGDVGKGGVLVKEAWMELRSYLLMAVYCKPPAAAVLPSLMTGLQNKMKELSLAVNRNDWEKHMKTLNEGIYHIINLLMYIYVSFRFRVSLVWVFICYILSSFHHFLSYNLITQTGVQALNWVMVNPAPVDFIESYVGGSDYWANNIRKEYRTTNPDQIAFCNTFKTLLVELMSYVKEYHKTGLAWNPKGVEVSAYTPVEVPLGNVSGKVFLLEQKGSKEVVASSGAKSDLFSALNKGLCVNFCIYIYL